MGQIVSFASNGSTCSGYEAVPATPGPGIIVIQEWWGLVEHIKDVCERFATEGFVALAPDLYHGDAAANTEPDKAGKLMMSMKLDEAGRDMAGAYDYLIQNPVVEPKRVGATGFCMGGNLALQVAKLRPITAVAPFYPYPFVDYPEASELEAAVQIHTGENDQGPSVEKATGYAEALRAGGRTAEAHIYPDCDHGFFNDTRPDAYEPAAAKVAWERTIAFFRQHVG